MTDPQPDREDWVVFGPRGERGVMLGAKGVKHDAGHSWVRVKWSDHTLTWSRVDLLRFDPPRSFEPR